MLTSMYAHADMLAAMEAAVLPDEEDLVTTTVGQPQTSHIALQPHSEAGQQQTAEQPQSSRSAAQSCRQTEPGQRTTVGAALVQQQPLHLRAPKRTNAMHGQHARQSWAAVLPASATSPDLLVCPFQTMLSTPERDARLVRSPGVPHRLHTHQVDPDFVWVDGLGAIERMKVPQLAGARAQRSAAAAPLMDSEASAAHQPQQAAPVARKPLVRAVPDLCTMQDVPEFWQTWQAGNGMEKAALKDLAAELIRPQKQRYSEWSKAARALEGQAQEKGVTSKQMAIILDAARMREGRNVAGFVKALGSKWLAEQRAAANAALQADELQE